MIMLNLTKIKNKPLLYLSVLLAVFTASLYGSQIAHADALQPTYTLSYENLISAKGGFVSDPNVTSQPIFGGAEGNWELGEPKTDYNKDYYSEKTAEVYFKYERSPNLYITHIRYAASEGVTAVTAGGDRLSCDVAIKLDNGSKSGGSFVGVQHNDDPSTQFEDPDCTAAVKDIQQLGSNQVAFGNISEPTGETFMGVTIETCEKGSDDYSACVNRRKNQIKQADAAIACSTSSEANIERCNYYKSIISCLKSSPSISVARCTAKADATRVLNGDFSVITASSTDEYIKDLCKNLDSTAKQNQCIDKATKERDRLKGEKEKCEKNGGTWNDSTGTCTPGELTTSCAVEGVGWIICPILRFMGTLNDAAFGFISDFLTIEPKLLTDNDTRAAWSNFRDIANVAFVIAFLIIVYSQITGTGVSNYGIKRMLPRLFIAAVLVNLSYFVCQIAVDLSNILGSSIYSFFKDMPTTDALTTTTSWKDNIGFVLALGAAVVVGLLALSVISTAALLAFALIILILVARKAALILLVVVSPLAFVAYLLPNTEKWFKKWWKMFSSLLLVFPVVGVIFGASTLAARIINNAGGDPNESNYMLQITALGVMAVPLFAVPIVLKGALSAAGSIGTKLSGMADRAQGRAGKKGSERLASRAERYKNRFNAANIGRSNRVREGSGGVLGGNNSRRRRLFAGAAGFGATRAVDNEQKDKYAKIVSEAAQRNYVADRASSDDRYATSLAGGDRELTGLVKSYALQAKEEEKEKDIKAAQVLLKEQSKSMSADKYADHLRTMITSGAPEHEVRAAIRQFSKVANATRVSQLTEDMAEMGAQAPGTERTASIQREFADTFSGDARLPSSMSKTMLSQAQNGYFSSKLADRMLADINGGYVLDDNGNVIDQRIDPQTGEVQVGKINKKYVSSMDVDEMKDWRAAIDSNPNLVNRMTSEGKQSVLQSMQDAIDDPRLNIGFGPREYDNMKRIASHLGGTLQRIP